MGRNKNQQKRIQKSRAVFKVAGHKALKAKSKAKEVTTNIKKTNLKMKEAVTQCNQQQVKIQTVLRQKPKKIKLEENTPRDKNQTVKQEGIYVDMDATVNEFQKL